MSGHDCAGRWGDRRGLFACGTTAGVHWAETVRPWQVRVRTRTAFLSGVSFVATDVRFQRHSLLRDREVERQGDLIAYKDMFTVLVVDSRIERSQSLRDALGRILGHLRQDHHLRVDVLSILTLVRRCFLAVAPASRPGMTTPRIAARNGAALPSATPRSTRRISHKRRQGREPFKALTAGPAQLARLHCQGSGPGLRPY